MGRTRRRNKRSSDKRRRQSAPREAKKRHEKTDRRKLPALQRLQTLRHFPGDPKSRTPPQQHTVRSVLRTVGNSGRTDRTRNPTDVTETVADSSMPETSDPNEYNCCGCIPADQGIFALSLLIFMLSTVLIFFFAEVHSMLTGVHYLMLILLIGLIMIFSGLVVMAICVNRSRLFLPILVVGFISDIYNLIVLCMLFYTAFFATDETFADWFKEKGMDNTKLVQTAIDVISPDDDNDKSAKRDLDGERVMLQYSCGVQLIIFLTEAYMMHAIYTAYKYIRKQERLRRRRPSRTEH